MLLRILESFAKTWILYSPQLFTISDFVWFFVKKSSGKILFSFQFLTIFVCLLKIELNAQVF